MYKLEQILEHCYKKMILLHFFEDLSGRYFMTVPAVYLTCVCVLVCLDVYTCTFLYAYVYAYASYMRACLHVNCVHSCVCLIPFTPD